LHLAVQEDLFLFLLYQEGWFGDCLAVRLKLVLLVALLIRRFRIRFAVENHLGPSTIGLENIEYLAEHRILRVLGAWVHEGTVLDAVFAEEFLLFLCY
jgi:hypothetical protein